MTPVLLTKGIAHRIPAAPDAAAVLVAVLKGTETARVALLNLAVAGMDVYARHVVDAVSLSSHRGNKARRDDVRRLSRSS